MYSSPLDKHKSMISYWVHGVYWNAGNCSTVELWNRHMCRYPASKKIQKQSRKSGGKIEQFGMFGCRLPGDAAVFASESEESWTAWSPTTTSVRVSGQTQQEPPHTSWKINMEPTNHPFRKENDLPNLHDYVHVNLQGCTSRMFLETKRDPSSAHIMFIKLDLRTISLWWLVF